MQRTALLDLLQEHLTNNVITCRGAFLCQTQGIPQVLLWSPNHTGSRVWGLWLDSRPPTNA